MEMLWYSILFIFVCAAVLIVVAHNRGAALRPGSYWSYLSNDQMRYVGLAALATLAALLLFDHLFPNTAAAYYNRGGPWYSLIVGVMAISVVALYAPSEGLRKLLTASIATVLIIAVATALIPALWAGSPPTEADKQVKAAELALKKEQVRQAMDRRTPECPGGVEKYHLTEDTITQINTTSCQNRLKLTGDECVDAYNSRKNFVGQICAKGPPKFKGTPYYLRAVGTRSEPLEITRCPDGSPIDPTNIIMGACI